MREKLIELLKDTRENAAWHHWGYEESADHLIANGVTVQRWIPVSERLPADDIPSKMYLCFWNGMIRVCKYWRTQKCFKLMGKNVKVTHWMPLPTAPEDAK